MSYCTQDDIEKRIGEAELVALADYDADGEADAEVVSAAIVSV